MTHPTNITPGDRFMHDGIEVEATSVAVQIGNGGNLSIAVRPVAGRGPVTVEVSRFRGIDTWREPVVGMGATLLYPQDRYGYVITRVSPSGKTVWVQPLAPVSAETGHEPARYDGPWPVWSHTYTDAERDTMRQEHGAERQVRLTKRGWQSNGTPFAIGAARYHRNYSW